MIGTTVGKYRIVDKLGRGGMGTVYKAVDQTLDREVAIKVLNPDLTDADVLKRFRGEAVTLARLNHAGIATIYELHHQDDELLMVMEFVRGETFHDLSDRLGPLAPPQAAHLCMQVLDALGHAHRGGVVHRDLKPANLMITEAGAVKVMDFGIARVLGIRAFHARRLHDGHASLHGARTGARTRDRWARRLVFRGRRPLPPAHRQAAVQCRYCDLDGADADFGAADADPDVSAGLARLVLGDYRSRAFQVALRSIPECGGIPRRAGSGSDAAGPRRNADALDADAAGPDVRSRHHRAAPHADGAACVGCSFRKHRSDQPHR